MKKTLTILFVMFTISLSYYFLSNQKESHYNSKETEISPESSRKINQIDQIANQLTSYDMLYGPAVGIFGAKMTAYEKFEELKKVAKDSDLILLMKRNHPILKACAFKILVERGNKEIIPIFEENINDKTVFKTYGGCIISRTYVNAYLLCCLKYHIDKPVFEKYREIVLDMYPEMNDWKLTELGLTSL